MIIDMFGMFYNYKTNDNITVLLSKKINTVQ